MKLAEALMLRADLKKKLASLRDRVGRNSVVQAGDTPHEDPDALIQEAFSVLKEQEQLVGRINEANLTSKLPDGRTIMAAIAERERLTQEHSLLQHAIANSQKEPNRYSMSEIKWVAVVKVAALQKQSEDIAQKIRKLNAAIQETNWSATLP